MFDGKVNDHDRQHCLTDKQCLGMNPDILSPGERCASTSNRNFEGRQGPGGRTHLMSPAMAAAAAIVGKLADVRKLSSYDKAPPNAKNAPATIDSNDPSSDIDLNELLDLDETSQGNTVSTGAPSSSGSGLPAFTQLKGIAAVLDRANVDTDAIIPKQFLKTIKRSGLSAGLFYESRFNKDGSKTDFVLNTEPYTKSKILVCTGPNFGCGSSREHAPWALLDFGIKCVIAPSYGDIFYNNTLKNGMLPIRITDQSVLKTIAERARAGEEIEVDLVERNIKDASGKVLAPSFEIDDFRRKCLIEGLDEIGLTLQKLDLITRFEQMRSQETPWIDGSGYLSRHRTEAVKVEAAPVPTTNRGEVISEPLEW